MLGEIKGKGAHHGSLTDFSVVMFVATVAYRSYQHRQVGRVSSPR